MWGGGRVLAKIRNAGAKEKMNRRQGNNEKLALNHISLCCKLNIFSHGGRGKESERFEGGK